MKKLLITGFDPFGGERINPSWEAVKLLPETIGEYALTKMQIPTVFGQAAEKVLTAAKELKPDVIFRIGHQDGLFSLRTLTWDEAAIYKEEIGTNQ